MSEHSPSRSRKPLVRVATEALVPGASVVLGANDYRKERKAKTPTEPWRRTRNIGVAACCLLAFAPSCTAALAGMKSAGRAVMEGTIQTGGKPTVTAGEIKGVKKILFQEREVTVSGLETTLAIHPFGKDLTVDIPFTGQKADFNPTFKTTVTDAKRKLYDVINVSDIQWSCNDALKYKRDGGTEAACEVTFDPSAIETIVEAPVVGLNEFNTVSTTDTGTALSMLSPLVNNERVQQALPEGLQGTKDIATIVRKTLEGTAGVTTNYMAAEACKVAFNQNPEAPSLMGDAIKKNVAKFAIADLSEKYPDKARPDVEDFAYKNPKPVEANPTAQVEDKASLQLQAALQLLAEEASTAGIANFKQSNTKPKLPSCAFTAEVQE